MDEPASHTLKDALSPNTDKPHRCSYCHSVFEALRGQRSVRNAQDCSPAQALQRLDFLLANPDASVYDLARSIYENECLE